MSILATDSVIFNDQIVNDEHRLDSDNDLSNNRSFLHRLTYSISWLLIFDTKLRRVYGNVYKVSGVFNDWESNISLFPHVKSLVSLLFGYCLRQLSPGPHCTYLSKIYKPGHLYCNGYIREKLTRWHKCKYGTRLFAWHIFGKVWLESFSL